MTNIDFNSVMSQRTDAELLEIVNKLRDDYQPLAVAAAEFELKKRQLTPDKIAVAEKEIEEKHAITLKKSSTPLEIHWRVLCFLFPGTMNLIMSFIFKGQGHDRKFKEAWLWTFYGLAFYIGAFSLFVVLARLIIS